MKGLLFGCDPNGVRDWARLTNHYCIPLYLYTPRPLDLYTKSSRKNVTFIASSSNDLNPDTHEELFKSNLAKSLEESWF